MSLKQYRGLDLLIFSLLAAASEFLGAFLLRKLVPGFTLSFAFLLSVVAIFRWGLPGGIVFVVSGLPLLLLYKDNFLENLLFYVAGNFFIFLVPAFVRRPLDGIRDRALAFNLFILAAFLAVVLGRTLALAVFGEPFLKSFRAVAGSLLLTYVASAVLLNLLKKTSGLLTDMKTLIEESNTERNYETRSENV